MITPILHRILIKPIELEKEHDAGGGIKLALAYGDNEKRHEAARIEGHIVSMGETADVPCKVGDHVVFAKYAGLYVNDPETDEEYVLINDEDILCIVRKGDK